MICLMGDGTIWFFFLLLLLFAKDTLCILAASLSILKNLCQVQLECFINPHSEKQLNQALIIVNCLLIFGKPGNTACSS